MNPQEATKQAIQAIIDVAREAGVAERQRLGRELTEAEAERLADMVMRQVQTAAALTS